jgi:catechol 2,3-dioxygenase-like lactoylglutathione lyase family enzyme
MVGAPRHLTLEVKYLDRAREFYESYLDLSVREARGDEVVYAVGDTELRLRAPGTVPRGGLHTHYALSVSRTAYDDWYDRLDAHFDLDEHRFGDDRSLYCYDPDGNCVELGETVDTGEGIQGLFEVVLEVEALEPAVDFYERLGFEIVDPGGERPRVRLTTGSVDLELWEPQLGLADARGGVHVDWGVEAADPRALAADVSESALAVEHRENHSLVRDPDGHYVGLFEPASSL